MTSIPLMGVIIVFLRNFIVKLTADGLNHYALAGNVAEEALSSIRTVASFMSQSRLAKVYSSYLIMAEKAGIKKSFVMGIGLGLFQLIIFSVYA